MIVIVNGDTRDVESGTSLEALLQRLELDGTRLVVQHNDEIIDKEAYPEVQLNENDQVELIQFVGGG